LFNGIIYPIIGTIFLQLIIGYINMNDQAQSPVVVAVAPSDETKRHLSKVVNMECAFEGYKVITRHGNLDYVTKLGKLLSNVSDIMGK
jgi:hypothetical protein